ncbi:MAG: GTPase ObgE, partial [Actinobacteria bacterium]|nr:GTPase ObgE [Actinomycetota bacterium]
MFIDEAKINVKGGNGGNGCVSFFYLKGRRKKVASGGDGGKGGDVILEATRSMGTLSHFKKKVHFKAQDGQRGMPNKKAGKDGENLVVYVPVGTVAKEVDGTIIADLDEEGKRVIVATGGMGGRGNSSFISQTRRFPSFAEEGEVVSDRWINLELRILADVALVGFPNVGKSTIISRISSARPKIADYPFTTLTPNLGVVTVGEKTFTVADIPGIIKDAHRGCGLGDRFLRHIKRTCILVMVLDGEKILYEVEDMIESFDILREELRLYDENLLLKDYIVVINKIDLINRPDDLELLEYARTRLQEKSGHEVYLISALTGKGLKRLVMVMACKVELV